MKLGRLKIDWILITAVFALTFFGLINIYAIDSIQKNDFLHSNVFKQVIWLVLSLIIFILIQHIDLKVITRMSFVFFILLSMLLLFLVIKFPPGFVPTINGAKRWFIIPFIGSFQPTEYFRIFVVIYIGKFIVENLYQSSYRDFYKDLLLLAKIGLILLIPFLLIFLQPNSSSILEMCFALIIILLVSGISNKFIYTLLIILTVIFALIMFLTLYNPELLQKIIGSYRVDRLQSWTNPFDNLDKSFQLRRSIIAVGSSGWFGNGFGHIITKLPEWDTDFIMATIINQFGFMGLLICFALSFIISFRMVYIIIKTNDLYEKIILVGLTSILIFQQLYNFSMVIGVLPISGISLPFVGYGGSSLLSYFIIISIANTIYANNEIINKKNNI